MLKHRAFQRPRDNNFAPDFLLTIVTSLKASYQNSSTFRDQVESWWLPSTDRQALRDEKAQVSPFLSRLYSSSNFHLQVFEWPSEATTLLDNYFSRKPTSNPPVSNLVDVEMHNPSDPVVIFYGSESPRALDNTPPPPINLLDDTPPRDTHEAEASADPDPSSEDIVEVPVTSVRDDLTDEDAEGSEEEDRDELE